MAMVEFENGPIQVDAAFVAKGLGIFRLADNEGNLLQRSALDFGDRGLPVSARKPGA